MGLSGLISPLIAMAFWRTYQHEFLLSFATGAGLLALSFVRLEQGRFVARVYVGVAGVTTLIFGAWFGWAPDVIVVLSYLVVAGGLLFGARFVYGLVLLVAALLLLGGTLIKAHVYSVRLPPELDPADYQTWLRTAVGYTLLTAAATWVVLQAVAGVARAQAEAARALTLARESLQEIEASRARRLQQEHALLDAQKLQSVAQLGDGFAHVVSNSLTVVRCACENARAMSSGETRRAVADAIREAVAECTRRTRELLLLSRPHNSEPARVELDSEVRALAESLAQRIRSNIRCEFELAPAGNALVPPSWLPQILTNLLLNAEAAIHGGGTIEISTRAVHVGETRTSTIDRLPPGSYAALEVKDDGEGMTREVIAHACEPFFSTRGRAGHDGLGLTLVHGMVRQLGGTLGLSSDERGSRVTVYLPVADPAPAALPASLETTTWSRAAPRAAAPAEPRDQRLRAPDAPTVARDTPPPSGAPTEPDWRLGALRRTARTAGIVGAAGAVAMGFFMHQWLFPSLLVLATFPLMFFVSDARVSYNLRLTMVLGTLLGVGALFLMRYSFLSAGAVAMLTQTVFLASLFGGRRLALVMLLVTALCFVLGGALWPHLDTSESLREMLFGDSRNWFRLAVILPLILLINGHTVLQVFRIAADRIETLEQARAELEHRQAQHQAETEALVRAETMRGRAERAATAGRLMGVVAHDLNNSLMTLLGWAELLETTETTDEAVQNLEQAVGHAEALLQTLRGTTKFDHRGAGLDLGVALRRAQAMLQAVWQTDEAQRCALELDAEPGCFVAIQEGSFRRLLVNLVTNARHALGERSGGCRVRLEHRSGRVQLSVSDTGSGMDPATQGKIFEPFFTTKPDHGTGLGLLSVSEIVNATGGALEVRSEPGQGSTFAIDWPLGEPGSAPAQSSARPISFGNSMRVLLVEDEPLVRELLARGLRSHGYDVVEAEDGDAAAAQLLKQGPFDALCTDAVMPGRSVLELISEYQAHDEQGLVLVISGYLPENLAPLLTRAGVSLLRKPFSHSDLAIELERLRQSRSYNERPAVRSSGRRS